MTIYTALLRGINVGGNNIIRMADLKSCFLDMGFRDVQTYIQSGNVVFRSADEGHGELTDRIQHRLLEAFDYKLPVLLRDLTEMETVVASAPEGFGDEDAPYKFDVLFLKQPLTADEALPDIPVNETADSAWPGPGVIYYRRSPEHLTKSGLNKLPSRPVYQKMTIRNWRTTRKLLDIGRQMGINPGPGRQSI
jgi:uncharacterized protein (DUF1697 family)